jgi:N-hydroxyarylamine O-acetyltransferase
MSELNTLFRRRLGISQNEQITFQRLSSILEKTAKTIPFENLCILKNQTNEITRENLINKMLRKTEGGLCYELNSIFYLFLIENGFDCALARGVVYKDPTSGYFNLGRTHVTILLCYEGKRYLIDTGFGGNLPLVPVPFSGDTVGSDNGEFRIKKEDTEHGDYIFEMKLKYKDADWRIGYAFDSQKTIKDISEFNRIQTIIAKNEESPFNKTPLVTKLVDGGNITLTNNTFTKWQYGVVTKEKIDHTKFKELLSKHFGM